jgi:hypothetical protein
MRAVRSGNPKLVEALLESTVIDPDLGSYSRSSPLRLVFKLYLEDLHQDFWEISRLLLLTFKVNPDRDKKLPTPAGLASEYRECVRLLEVYEKCRKATEHSDLQLYDEELMDLRWTSST